MNIPDGTYLYQNGGLTPITVTDGYWVAEREITPAELTSGMIVGVWTDTDTGKVWLDKTRLVKNLTRATQLAVLWNQLAVWDNANQREIRVNA
jgi:hypothetical protein